MFINLGSKIKDNDNFKKVGGIKASFFDSLYYCLFHQPQDNRLMIDNKKLE
jgi:hypothetical protein